ncbi:MAG: hypothetical protein FWF30_03490 [Coriobacteriia bacterium]|nr:hypothetical protein [Coriobacteriia bacterium]
MSNQASTKDAKTTKAPSGFLWIILIALGFLFELATRFFGMEFNPSGIWLDFAPLLGIVAAGLLLLFAAFRIMKSWPAHNLPAFRFDLLLVLFGLTLLMSSYVGKAAMPLIFS